MPYPETHTCLRCHGDGWILICPDDLCHGAGYCIHGDGEMMCPECDGKGFHYNDEEFKKRSFYEE